jgi:hypothetical protein
MSYYFHPLITIFVVVEVFLFVAFGLGRWAVRFLGERVEALTDILPFLLLFES